MPRFDANDVKVFPSPNLSPRPWQQRNGAAYRPYLEIGIVNNMPDAALVATERQFTGLVQTAAAGRPVRIRYFSLASVPRGPDARMKMNAHYRGLDELENASLDALIITGTEPKAPKLRDEPYWDDFKTLVDWAADNTVSTIFSCLAAHAAVLHMDNVQRHRLPEKCSGVYEAEVLAKDPVLSGFVKPLQVSHSRLNTLDAGELSRAGYRVLTQSIFAGVDSFTKNVGSKFVFFNGHPEYDETSLLREYRRDVTRFLNRERDTYPNLPFGYFDARLEEELHAFRNEAERRSAMATIDNLPELAPRKNLGAETSTTATKLYQNWFNMVFENVFGTPALQEMKEV